MTGDGEFPQLIPDAVDEMSKIGGHRHPDE